MACVAWCGIGHQAMHIIHLKPTWCGIGHQAMHMVHLKPTWCGIGHQAICTWFTSNLHGVCGMVWYRTSSYAHRSPQTYMACGMVWYRTSSYAHRSPQTYMACVAWCGIGHQAMHIVHLKPTWRVAWCGIGHQELMYKDVLLCSSDS